MTDKDNILLENFFKEAAQQRIEDNGFTERVMNSLPSAEVDKEHRLVCLWTLFCLFVGLVLFLVFGGWEALKESLMVLFATGITSVEVFLTTIPTADVQLNPLLVLLVVVFVGVFLPYQTYRKLSAAL